MRILAVRAEATGIARIQSFEDIVPLLFSHTTYKSYPMPFVTKGQWDRMTQWFSTLSAVPVDNVDLNGIQDIDDWLQRLEDAGHIVITTSGTTGKVSIMNRVAADTAIHTRLIAKFSGWPDPIQAKRNRHYFSLAPREGAAMLVRSAHIFADVFGRPDSIHFLGDERLRNSPGVAAASVVRGAITKGVSLIKLPSNDLFSATAILRIMARVAPDHPIVRSFTAAYWRGGDESIEARIFQPQYFDKLIAWGGESTIRSALKHVGPGFELISFDPKTSISFIGREAFAGDVDLAQIAELAASDATHFNQQACVCSRIQFVEGTTQDADRYAPLLQQAMRKERPTAAACVGPLPGELREQIEVLRALEPVYRVWGGYEGEGLVIRSEEPVDFYPDGKVVNVVPVEDLADAVQYANVATKTVGIYPPARRREFRDALMSAGVQGVCSLGSVMASMPGLPHDGYLPLNRFVRWVKDED